MCKWLIDMLNYPVIITALGICLIRYCVGTVFNYPSVQSKTSFSMTLNLNLCAFTAFDSAENLYDFFW